MLTRLIQFDVADGKMYVSFNKRNATYNEINSIPNMRIAAKVCKWGGMPNSRGSTIYFKLVFVALKPG